MSLADELLVGLGAVQALATILIAVVLYRQAQKLKRIEVHGQAIQAFNVLNTIAISSPENLATFDSLGRPNTADDDTSRRRRWCAFVWLEALQVTFAALKHDLIDKSYAEQALRQQLEVILKDDLVYWLVANRGFDPSFVKYCTSIRLRVVPGNPTDYSEETAIKGIAPGTERQPNQPLQPTGFAGG